MYLLQRTSRVGSEACQRWRGYRVLENAGVQFANRGSCRHGHLYKKDSAAVYCFAHAESEMTVKTMDCVVHQGSGPCSAQRKGTERRRAGRGGRGGGGGEGVTGCHYLGSNSSASQPQLVKWSAHFWTHTSSVLLFTSGAVMRVFLGTSRLHHSHHWIM